MFKFFKFPFASQGDKNSVPDGVQTDGSVSYEQGFGYDYARNLADDPLAKPMPRDKTNQLFHDITLALQEYQTKGIPDYIDASQNGGNPYPYGKLAVVAYNGSVFVSLKDSNTSAPTVAADWDEVPGTKATAAEAVAGTDDTKIMTPAKVKAAVAGKQPLDANLTALAALVTAANKLIYATGADTFSTTDFTAFARTLLDDTDAASMRATLGLGDVSTKTVSVDFGSSISSNGYQKLPNGLVIQWVTGSIISGSNIAFPIAFPNACLAAVTNGSGNYYTWHNSFTATSVNVGHSSGGQSGMRVFAIGY